MKKKRAIGLFKSFSSFSVASVYSVDRYFFTTESTENTEKIHPPSLRLRLNYGVAGENRENFYNELTWRCVNQYGSFNSPVWFNVGLFDVYNIPGSNHNYHWDDEKKEALPCESSYEYPQASACFIQSVKDSMQDIMRLATSEAMLFKHGSGTGTDLSTLRSSKEKLSGGGKPSGPLSFMRVYDQIAAVIKSGGKTRRAAKMQSLKVTHPDIREFITCKA